MPSIAFDELPDHARVWIFAASRPLHPEERDALLAATDEFLGAWAAHGVPLTSGRDWRYDRFLMVGVDESQAGVSGCSIDALTHRLRDFERRLDVVLLDHGPVLYRAGARVERRARAEFAKLADTGDVSPDTVVFDNAVRTVGAIRAGRWEGPARNAWHGRAFFGGRPATAG